MASQQRLSRLPKGFIFAAFANFTAGAVLGGLMTLNPLWMAALAPIHAILNPYGWLTVLIYGMTFAVLSLSLGVRLPTVWQGWVQWVMAEGGVLLLIIAVITSSQWVNRIGLSCLVLAPLLFLVNILSGVRYTKRLEHSETDVPEQTLHKVDSNVDGSRTFYTGSAVRLFGRFARYQRTDAVGQRGTDVSLMLFIAAVLWSALYGWTAGPDVGLTMPTPVRWLTYYGWIGGTTLSVALHLAPRFMQRTVGRASVWNLLQAGWFGGVGLSLLGVWFGSSLTHIGSLFVGLSLIVTAVRYIGFALWTGSSSDGDRRRRGRPERPLHGPGTVAWVMSWLFAAILGGYLMLSANAFSLSSIHLLFLGFITSLVYAVGYTAFPTVLQRRAPHQYLAYAQLFCSGVGAILLIWSFWELGRGGGLNSSLLAVGGVLATVGVLAFFSYWIASPRTADV